jgi:hypothetical protein
MAHVNSTINANKTISGGSIAHVGQLFFDQNLIAEVEKVDPYNKNKDRLTTNKQDGIMRFSASGLSDPVVEYVMLGSKIEDGLFAFINFGIDTKLSKKVRVAAECSESGCVANKNGFGFGGLFGFGKPPGGAGGLPPKGSPRGPPKGDAPKGVATPSKLST